MAIRSWLGFAGLLVLCNLLAAALAAILRHFV